MVLLLSSCWAAFVTLLILRAWSQRGLLHEIGNDCSPRLKRPVPNVAVIVPARNEEVNIAFCLHGLLSQTYPQAKLQLVVVDDHSSDATGTIARSIAHADRCLRVFDAPDLPPHWMGKPHACWSAVRMLPNDVEWLCFIDADVRAAPRLLASAVAKARDDELDLLSLMPRQELGSFAEKLVIPCGLFFMGFRQNLRQLQSPKGKDATVSGQFMLVRTSAYKAVGGHRAVRAEICEDVALARRLKRSGYRVILHDGKLLLTSRMYTGWRDLWPGFAKNLVETAGGPLATAISAATAVLLAWAALFMPAYAAIGCANGSIEAYAALITALLASTAAFGLHIAGATYFGIPFWYGLLFPLGYTIGAVIALDSVRHRLIGRVTWKGRTYALNEAGEGEACAPLPDQSPTES